MTMEIALVLIFWYVIGLLGVFIHPAGISTWRHLIEASIFAVLGPVSFLFGFFFWFYESKVLDRRLPWKKDYDRY